MTRQQKHSKGVTALNGYQSPPPYYAVGDTGPAGGIVFYVTDGGLHGLEAAPENVSTDDDATWGCSGTLITGADGTEVGTGAQNTADILAECSEEGIAAAQASAYELNGYADWFLPSKEALDLLYEHKGIVGGFGRKYYWSSTQGNANNARYITFQNGAWFNFVKTRHLYVRAIRAF